MESIPVQARREISRKPLGKMSRCEEGRKKGRKEGRMEVEKRIDGREFVGLVRSQTIIFDCLIRFVMLELIDSFLRVQDSMFIGGFFSLESIILYASDTRTCLR